MSFTDKVLGIASMGSTVANVSLLKRFLAGLAVVIALTAISGTMAGVVLIAGFYGLYLGLLRYGVAPQTALITVGSLALVVTASFAALATLRWRQLRDMPQLMQESPILGHIGKLADAFVDGLLTDRDR